MSLRSTCLRGGDFEGCYDFNPPCTSCPAYLRRRATLITFEGLDGCGKTTQVNNLIARLQGYVPEVRVYKEPGGTALGEAIEKMLKWDDLDIRDMAELLLFNASRAQLVSKVIKPALNTEMTVILDRFFDSTVAYQGYGRQMPLQVVKNVVTYASAGVEPDLTILLDIEPEAALRRKNATKDRIEIETLEFHKRVREGYLRIAGENPRVVIIDAKQSIKSVEWKIWTQVLKLYTEKKGEYVSHSCPRPF